MKTRTSQPINLLDLKPLRNLAWETCENGLIVLLVPKFKNRYLVKWLVPHLAKPNFRVKLDAFGSFVWSHCDGNTTIAEMGEKMRAKFGETVEPLYDRIAQFIQKLEREKFLRLN
jgi:hypothetical protein